MPVIMKDKTVYINEEARAKLMEFWITNYLNNMKRLIPEMAADLADNHIAITGVKIAPTDAHQLLQSPLLLSEETWSKQR